MKSSCGIFVMALLAGMGCKGKSPPPIVVGHVAALSGPDKRAGLQASLGIRLALEELNKDAEKQRIEVRHTDTRGSLDAFETQAVRLLAVNRVAALLGGDNADEVQRLDRAVQPETPDQPVFVPIVSPSGWRTRSLSKQVFLTGMTPQAQAKILARHAVEELSVTRLSLLVDQANDRAQTLAEVFVREFVEAGRTKKPEPIKPPLRLFTTDAQLTEMLARTGADGPQAVLVAGTTEHLRLTSDKLKQMSEKSKQPPPILLYAGADGSLTCDDWPMVTQKGAGVIYLASAFGYDKNEPPEFVQKFRKQFQEEPEVHAALAYEGLKLLADALRQGPDVVKERAELVKTKDFPGLAGPLSFDGDQVMTRTLYVLRLDRDQMVVMKKYAP